MNSKRRIACYGLVLAVGAVLFGLGAAKMVDDFWNGMGAGLMAVGVVRLIRLRRFQKDEAFREKVEIAASDERNRFIRGKAWAWAGYLFILIGAVSIIVLRILGQDVLSMAASYAVCLMLVLYWGSYWLLQRKY